MTDKEFGRFHELTSEFVEIRQLVLHHDPLNKVEDAFLNVVGARLAYAISLLTSMTRSHLVDCAQEELKEALEAQEEATND